MSQLIPSSTVERIVQSNLGKVTSLPLATGAAVENGDSVEAFALNKLFLVEGITTATVHVDGSIDGTNWYTLGNVTADGKIANTEPWKYVRARISAYTSGTITVNMCE